MWEKNKKCKRFNFKNVKRSKVWISRKTKEILGKERTAEEHTKKIIVVEKGRRTFISYTIENHKNNISWLISITSSLPILFV